jgi:hypothetical protein
MKVEVINYRLQRANTSYKGPPRWVKAYVKTYTMPPEVVNWLNTRDNCKLL